MIESPPPPPILEHFCPIFVQIARMSLILPRWGLILPRMPPHPLFFTQQSHAPVGICTNTNTPNPTQKHSISWPELESGQNELQSGQNETHLGNLYKKWAKLF